MKTNWKLELPQWALIAAMFAAAAIAWPAAPARLPVHWNAAGEVDRYGGRFEGLLLIPLMGLGLYLLLLFIPRLDPRRSSYARFWGAYSTIRIALQVLLAVVYAVILGTTFGARLEVGVIVSASVGALFIVLGMAMRRFEPNWFAGIRTPWTLSSDEVWRRTHEFGGRLFVLMGLGIMLLGFLKGMWAVIGILVLALGGALTVVVYSYVAYRRLETASR